MNIHLPIKNTFLLLTAALLISACQNTALQTDTTIDEPTDPGTAAVQFIHSASSTGELDVIYRDTNGSYYLLESATSYGHQYGFYDFQVRDLELLLVPANTNITVSQDTIPLIQDKKYTVIASDYDATLAPDMVVLQDTLYSAGQGSALVRFVQLASGIESVKIDIKDGATLTQLDAGQNSGYIKLAASTYSFMVSEADSGTVLLNRATLTFLSDQNYTVVLSGSAAGLSPVALNLKSYYENGL